MRYCVVCSSWSWLPALRGRGSEQGSCVGGDGGQGTQGKGLGMVGAGQPLGVGGQGTRGPVQQRRFRGNSSASPHTQPSPVSPSWWEELSAVPQEGS